MLPRCKVIQGRGVFLNSTIKNVLVTACAIGSIGGEALCGAPAVRAQQPPIPIPPAMMLSYAAKFVCGPTTTDIEVVRGVYATAINIHNPNPFPVRFRKKAVVANVESGPRGPISKKLDETLQPDEAMFVDCSEVRTLLGPAITKNLVHFEGFVVLEVPEIQVNAGAVPFSPELDVIGKYTARPENHGVSSIDIVTVPGRTVIATSATVCLVPADCISSVCNGGTCAAPTCIDGVKNGSETDTDCGGPVCPTCGLNKQCVTNADCQSKNCVKNICQP
jgi:hypothetical protein